MKFDQKYGYLLFQFCPLIDFHCFGGLKLIRILLNFTCLFVFWLFFQVSKDAELSQAPERSTARQQTVIDSENAYDLLTVALVRRAQYGMLAEVSM